MDLNRLTGYRWCLAPADTHMYDIVHVGSIQERPPRHVRAFSRIHKHVDVLVEIATLIDREGDLLLHGHELAQPARLRSPVHLISISRRRRKVFPRVSKRGRMIKLQDLESASRRLN